ncbi:MAG: fumarate/nitrate reduction transcriptional regulator Fnr [Thiohalobacterales bacterium]
MPARKKLKIDEIKVSCSNCSLADLCLPHGMNTDEMEALDSVIKHQAPLQPGQHLYRSGDPGISLFAVRSGCLKTYCTTEDGDEQVLGFTLPGELVGLDGLNNGHYVSNSIALETASVCAMPYDHLENLCRDLPSLQRQVMRIVGKEVTADQEMLMLLGKRSAEERLAAFLVSLSIRYQSRNLSATEFNLPMSRQDIGNYLGLAIETVSRLFAHFQEQKLLTVNRRAVVLTDLERLKGMVEGCQLYKSATS